MTEPFKPGTVGDQQEEIVARLLEMASQEAGKTQPAQLLPLRIHKPKKKRQKKEGSEMTVNKLHKLLGKLIEKGQGRLPICVSKTSFKDNCESDGHTILPINGVTWKSIYVGDDDGGVKENKDGSERMANTVIIYGNSGTEEHPWEHDVWDTIDAGDGKGSGT